MIPLRSASAYLLSLFLCLSCGNSPENQEAAPQKKNGNTSLRDSLAHRPRELPSRRAPYPDVSEELRLSGNREIDSLSEIIRTNPAISVEKVGAEYGDCATFRFTYRHPVQGTLLITLYTDCGDYGNHREVIFFDAIGPIRAYHQSYAPQQVSVDQYDYRHELRLIQRKSDAYEIRYGSRTLNRSLQHIELSADSVMTRPLRFTADSLNQKLYEYDTLLTGTLVDPIIDTLLR